MTTVKGDLLQMAREGYFDVIIHGCNCFCTMGAGIAAQIAKQYPEAATADLRTETGSRDKLGTISSATIVRERTTFIIVNAYTQFHWGRKHGIPLDYSAVRSCFKKIKELFSEKRIGYPAIGAGLAGGKWPIIKKIIDEELEGENHTFVEWSR